MRDPARIDPTIEALRKAWKANPDQRLSQLVCNAARVKHPGVLDPFYVEDDELSAGLDAIGGAQDG